MMRWQILTMILVMFSSSAVGCKKKDKGGGDNPPPGSDGGDGGDTGGEFDFSEAGVLALSFGEAAGELGGGANLANFQAVAPPVPEIAATVESATPGNVLISTSIRSNLADISCAGVDSSEHARWFACKAINGGNAGYPYVLEEMDSRLARISAVGAKGALCFETARTAITITENNLSIPQELSCWDAFQSPSTEGMAFGYSASKVWMRLSDGYGTATIDIDSNGDAENIDVWSVSTNTGGSTSQLMRIKSTGTASVEITAAGSNLNAHYSNGVQVLLDKANDMMYMRYICDAPQDGPCGGDRAFMTFCTDLSDGDLTDSDTCGTIAWTLPMLVLDDTVSGLPTDTIKITQADITGIGAATKSSLSTLMSLRIPSPLATLRDSIFNGSSTSLEGLLQSVDGELTKVEGWITNDPAQCLVELPKVLDITTPVDLNTPLLVSCQPNDDSGWTVYGQANGTTSYGNKNESDKSGSLISFDANRNMKAWIVRPYADKEMLYQVAVSTDGVAELTGMQKGGPLACGIHYKTNGTYFFVRSPFDETKCASGAAAAADYFERCVNVSDLTYKPIATCSEAGLDIFTLSPMSPQAVAYTDIKNIMPAAPALNSANGPVNTTTAPPIATIPLPETGDGGVEVVPVRTRNLTVGKLSGGGINYGRNCRHATPVGNATANAVYELPLSELAPEKLTALVTQIAANNAFVSFNFSEDLLNIGNGASATRDLTFKVSLVDTSGTELKSKIYTNADLVAGSQVAYSMLVGQTVDATQKIVATLSGTAAVTCAGDSGQAHMSAGINDFRLRF